MTSRLKRTICLDGKYSTWKNIFCPNFYSRGHIYDSIYSDFAGAIKHKLIQQYLKLSSFRIQVDGNFR